ncbi:MAG: HNH endonuclease [Actinobacteria bacterium]|nr:HNH endonuclease [Actinomycetota bacterium]
MWYRIRYIEVHHRIPLAQGGMNGFSNLDLRCHRCSARAGRDAR